VDSQVQTRLVRLGAKLGCVYCILLEVGVNQDCGENPFSASDIAYADLLSQVGKEKKTSCCMMTKPPGQPAIGWGFGFKCGYKTSSSPTN
jgi:hypothetical protein